MRLLTLAAVALVLACAAGCSDSEDRWQIVAAAHSRQTPDCAPAPLQLIEWPSGEVRIGPSDRYIGLEFSPSGDRIAASRWDWDECADSDDEDAATHTTSVVLIDTETFEATELTSTHVASEMLRWSADGRYLAFLTVVDGLVIVDVDAGARVREVPLDGWGGWQNRALFVGPEGGDYLYVYAHRQSFFGVPRDHDAEIVSWTPECETSGTLFAQRVKASADGEVTAYYLCGNESVGPPYRWEAPLDLNEGMLEEGMASADLDAWLGVYSDIQREVEVDYPGAAVWGVLGTDYRQELFFLATTYSPSGVDVQASIRAERGYPADAKAAVAILTADGELITVPVDVELGTGGSVDPIDAYAPLHDVFILD